MVCLVEMSLSKISSDDFALWEWTPDLATFMESTSFPSFGVIDFRGQCIAEYAFFPTLTLCTPLSIWFLKNETDSSNEQH